MLLQQESSPGEEVWDKLAGGTLTARKFPWGGGVRQTLLSPSAPRGKVVAVVRDCKLCVETEILLWEKGRKEGREHFLTAGINSCSLAACILLICLHPTCFLPNPTSILLFPGLIMWVLPFKDCVGALNGLVWCL